MYPLPDTNSTRERVFMGRQSRHPLREAIDPVAGTYEKGAVGHTLPPICLPRRPRASPECHVGFRWLSLDSSSGTPRGPQDLAPSLIRGGCLGFIGPGPSADHDEFMDTLFEYPAGVNISGSRGSLASRCCH